MCYLQWNTLTSGGGSKAWKEEVNEWDSQEMKFYYDGQVFMLVYLSESELLVVFLRWLWACFASLEHLFRVPILYSQQSETTKS